MTASWSLRARLTAIILAPIFLLSLVVGAASMRDAELRAADLFDRSLLTTALAISRDTAFSGGNALVEETRDLLRDTSGGRVYYHVYAPDGAFVTGYATPPAPETGETAAESPYHYFDAVYHARAVRAVKFRDRMSIDGLNGEFTFTVWQDLAVRDAVVDGLTRRSFAVLAPIIAALAFIVWFGVRLGLRPLNALEAAISRRSAADLSPIRRSIPIEVRGVVSRLNGLLGDLEGELRAKNDFVSNAAHQLRNPMAGVLALAEAVAAAPKGADLAQRTRDLVDATRRAARLTEDLLAFERAAARGRSEQSVDAVDLAEALRAIEPRLAQDAGARNVALEMKLESAPIAARIDRTMAQQAVTNLVANALQHGGDALSRVSIELAIDGGGDARITVTDDGVGVAPSDFAVALERFGQVAPSTGAGLGLPIAKAVAEGAGGSLSLVSEERGLTACLRVPLATLSERHFAGGSDRECLLQRSDQTS